MVRVAMAHNAAEYLFRVLCIPKHLQPKASMVRQHVKEQVVSSLPDNINAILNTKNDNCNLRDLRNIMAKEATQVEKVNLMSAVPKSNITYQGIEPHLKTEMIPPLTIDMIETRKVENPSVITSIEDPCDVKAKMRTTAVNFAEEYNPDPSRTCRKPPPIMEQHKLRTGVILPLPINLFDNRKIDNPSVITSIQNPCEPKTDMKSTDSNFPQKSDSDRPKRDHRIYLSMEQRLKTEVIPPIPINLFDNREINNPSVIESIQEPGEANAGIKTLDFNIAQKLNSGITNIQQDSCVKTHSTKDETIGSENKWMDNKTANDSATPITRDNFKEHIMQTQGCEIELEQVTYNNVSADDLSRLRKDSYIKQLKYNAECHITPIDNKIELDATSVKHDLKQNVCEFSETVMSNANNHITSMIKECCGNDAKHEAQSCNVKLIPKDNLKRFKTNESTKDMEHFSRHRVPPLSGKVCVAMQVRFNIKKQTEKKVSDSKTKSSEVQNSNENSCRFKNRNLHPSKSFPPP